MVSDLAAHPDFKKLTRWHKQPGAQDATKTELIELLQADARPGYK